MKESIGKNIRKIITGGAILGTGLLPKESDAQNGLVGKVKDIIKDKIEVVSNGVGEVVHREHKEYPQESKKDSIIYNWGGDKVGFKYPFEKVYKSDENFYRTVAYGNMKNAGIGSQSLVFSEETAKMNALFNILKTEMNIEGDIKIYKESYGSTQIKNGDKKIDLGHVRIIDKVTFKDTQTGVYTTVISVEVEKNRIKIEKIELNSETGKNSDQTFNEDLSDSTNWQEVQAEKPIEPPIRNKPKEQPVYTPEKKSDYHVTFEDFKKAKQAEFDEYKKGKESDFDKYKKSQEEEFKKFQERK